MANSELRMPEKSRLVCRGSAPRFLEGLLLAAALCWLAAGPATAADGTQSPAEQLTAETKAHLDKAQSILDEIVKGTGPRTVETLEKMNDLSIELDAAANRAGLMENVHPDSAVRAVAEKATQDVQAFATALSLNRPVYDALAAIDASTADAITKRHLRLLLRDYRRSGVDKDEATRKKIQEIRDELVKIGQEFDRNIREGQRFVYVTSAEMAGLSDDYVKAHPPDSTGKIKITTEYPDFFPFMNYAKSGAARKRIYVEFMNRAYPQNKLVLERLMAKRTELARLLGYPTWAAYIIEDKMAKSDRNVADFIAKLERASRRRSDQDYAMLLARKRKDQPKALRVEDWERRYYSELVRAERYDFDSQQLRPYYNYPEVKKGILGLTSRLFGVTFRPLADAKTWYPDVEAYEVFEGDRLMGRFYLDMHPRDGKYGHAAQFPMVNGVEGRQVPEAALVCNFPKPDSAGVGLMEQDDVETFLHEFGHLLHTVFGGRQHWIDRSGISTEFDFAEAPSQMLEEWARDPKTLQTFAKHYQTGAPVPAALLAKLQAARDFGNGLFVRQQNFYSALSLDVYDRDPARIDLDRLSAALQLKYSPWRAVPGTHMYASFDHLEGYSAIYYTYMWSLVIAKDMFSKFDPSNLLDPGVATEYRHKVLDPGGTRDAAESLRDFLGRPYDFRAFEQWLNRGAGAPAKRAAAKA